MNKKKNFECARNVDRKIKVEFSNEEEMSSNEHPLELEDAIRNGQVVVATDASMDGNLMPTHWLVASFENQIKIEGGVETTKWENRMTSAEVPFFIHWTTPL